MLFMYRDPRDLPISYERFAMSVDYSRQSSGDASFQNKLAAIEEPARRVEYLIRDHMALFPLVDYSPWLHSDIAIGVRFEDLYPEVLALQSGAVGPVLKKIMEYTGLLLSCPATELFARTHGSGPTFAPGTDKVGRFRSFFDNTLWDLTDSAFYRMVLAIYRYPSNASLRKSVSVVIVNYNGGAMLTECVRSVLASSVRLEVFVSDNGSQDGSIAFLRGALEYSAPVTVIENRENLGFAKGCNVALPHCRGEYVLFLNPDCVVNPGTLEEMIRVMYASPEAGMASCLVLNGDGTEQVSCRRFVPTPWRSMMRVLHLHRVIRNHPRFRSFEMKDLPLPREPEPVEAISGAFMFLRSAAIRAVGPLDEGYFLHCEDLDLCMRFREAGWKILFVPHVRIVHHKGMSGSRIHPVRVEYHKHYGMIRFYNKFFRKQYPGILMVAVATVVWVRFVLKASWVLLLRFLGGGRTIETVNASAFRSVQDTKQLQ